jgi:hypothetical protein
MFITIVVEPAWSTALSTWYDQQLKIIGDQPCMLEKFDTMYYSTPIWRETLEN